MTLQSRLVLCLMFMPVVCWTFLFLPAGSFRFWQGGAYFLITFACIPSLMVCL
jgi:hypothetical protein